MHASRLVLSRYGSSLGIRRTNLYKEGEGEGGGEGGEGEGGAGAGGGAGGGANSNRGGKGNGNGNGNGNKKMFDQEAVDRIVKERLKKQTAEREQLVSELDSLRQQGLTPENQKALEDRIEALQNEGKTKEQLATEERGKLEKRLTGEVTKKDGEVKLWKGRYETFRSQTEILTAATGAKAHNPTQVYQILRPDTVMVEELGSDGKPTGDIVPRVKFRDVDKDGQPVTLELSVPDAIKRMTEMEIHANLFDSGGSGGLGGRNNGRSGGTGTTTVPTDTKSYMEQRKKNPNLLKQGTKA